MKTTIEQVQNPGSSFKTIRITLDDMTEGKLSVILRALKEYADAKSNYSSSVLAKEVEENIRQAMKG